MILVLYGSDGRVHSLTPDGVLVGEKVFVGGREVADGIAAGLLSAYVPDQSTAHLYVRDEGLSAKWPNDLIQYTASEAAALVDRDTDTAIGATLHPFAARGEEAACTREQIQAILAKLGMKPTAKFARLTEIAQKAIAVGKDAKATKAG